MFPPAQEQPDLYSTAAEYYGEHNNPQRIVRNRTFSIRNSQREFDSIKGGENELPRVNLRRRASHDVSSVKPRKFLVDVDATLAALLASEDTDNNMQITVEDSGPKILPLGTVDSNGINKFGISGTYMLSNLLQELTLAKEYGRQRIVLDEGRLNENPVARLSRLIRTTFWDGLTRRIDAAGLELICKDPKNRHKNQIPVIYIPHGLNKMYNYYCQVQQDRPHLHLEVELLPPDITPEWVHSKNSRPGILALAMDEIVDPVTGEKTLRGIPFVVPGGRFNEMYGWDSYFEILGLLVDGRVDLARGMVEHFIFEITHYGKILNANRTYYLNRSQPPFLTDMALRVYEKIKHEPEALDFLRRSMIAAIREMRQVWMCAPRLDPITGLSRYRPDGIGIPTETEVTHFYHVLKPYAEKHNMTFEEFQHAYNGQQIHEAELDKYMLHDRAVRESGHDTTYRFEGICADLATIDLNALLYKYEVDIATTIRSRFGNRLVIPGQPEVETSAKWDRAAARRKIMIDRLLWNDKKGSYFDYDTLERKQRSYESATALWSLWAGVASPKQAAIITEKMLPKLTERGGLVAGTQCSRGELALDAPNRQWDYPYGWAPQQMLAWVGLARYGYLDEVQNLVYRWLFMITKSFMDYNGVVVEKYDVTRQSDPHRVDAEYGNQGLDFAGVAREGFGWVNASYQVGLTYLNSHAQRALGACTPPSVWQSSSKIHDPDFAALDLAVD